MITGLVLAAATGLLPLAAVPAAAAPAAAPMSGSPCSGTSGVTVVVDFGSHGGTVVRCATGDPASASQALKAARFTQVRVERQPAFLCRIDGVPSEKDDACVVTPPATAYWALWSATRGGGWTFANVGVDLLDPKPGSVVGFAFGAGAEPRVAPPALAAAPRPPASRTVKLGDHRGEQPDDPTEGQLGAGHPDAPTVGVRIGLNISINISTAPSFDIAVAVTARVVGRHADLSPP